MTVPLSSSKNISYGIWYPGIARTHVTQARGVHFGTMGHSAPRTTEETGLQKRLELLPEETLYLVERGALLCWKESQLLTGDMLGMEDIKGSPMTVQQAYVEMIGIEGLKLEHYQVGTIPRDLLHPIHRFSGICIFETPRIHCNPGSASFTILPYPHTTIADGNIQNFANRAAVNLCNSETSVLVAGLVLCGV